MRLDVAPEPTPEQHENVYTWASRRYRAIAIQVTAATKARRRAASKVARRSRRLNRGRA